MKQYVMTAACVFALASSPAVAQNIVNDPGFETAPAPLAGYNTYGPGQTFGGWTVVGTTSGNSGLTLGTNYQEPGVSFNAHSGSTSVDLTAAGNTGPANGIFQNLTTVAGQAYNVSFWLGNADGNGNYGLPSSLTLTIGGGLGQLFTNSNITSGAINWQRFTTSFVANSGSTQLLFGNATPAGDNFAGLDDVSVSAAPEPATWAMMIGGFGIAGVSLRRRKAQARTANA